jgi:hypothetical protein
MTPEQDQTLEVRNRIAAAAGAALLFAGLILVMLILPSQFSVDPVGTGTRIGLGNLGLTGQQLEALETATSTVDAQAPIVVPQERAFQRETVEFTVAAGEGMEYKYRLDQGEGLLFGWEATGVRAISTG